MSAEKKLAGAGAALILKLLEEQDMYGYQITETLAQRSDVTFRLKAGTLYPLLHSLEAEGAVRSYVQNAEGNRERRYYHLTERGRKLLRQKEEEWDRYSAAVSKILKGGAGYAAV